MTMRGRGGLPPRKTPYRPGEAAVAPGSKQITKTRELIIGPNGGMFLYAGQPAAGNPPVLWSVSPGTSADPYGNPLPGGTNVFGAGLSGSQTLIDNAGDITLTGPGGQLAMMPAAALPFSLGTALSGIMQSLVSLGSGDSNQAQAGVLSGITLGTGTAAKMGTLLTSPYGSTTGMGVLLQAENDGATDTASALLGTVTTQSGTLTFTPLFGVLPGALIGYGGSGVLTVVTKTTANGSGTIPIPAGVSVAYGESWGHGGNSGGGASGGGGGAGSGAGYGAEPALAVTGGGTVAFNCPGHGGGDTTLTGSAVTVTAHPGNDGGAATSSSPGTGAAGPAASGNTIAFGGGPGGTGGAAGGGGGGSSAGPGGAGRVGGHGAPGGSGQPGIPPSGGAYGGQGGTSGHAGTNGAAPGAGAGASGAGNGAVQSGGAAQVRLTYSTGSVAVMWSMNGTGAAITDQFGNSLPVGNRVNDADGNSYRTERLIQQVSPRAQSIASTTGTAIGGLSAPVGIGTYLVTVYLIMQWNAAAGQPSLQWTGPTISQFDIAGESRQVGSAATTNTNAVWNNGTVNGGGYNSGSQNITQAMTAAGAQFVIKLWGQFVFTASGTLKLVGITSVAADPWIAESGWWEIQPL